MSSDISAELRRLLRQRANNRCEYCLLPQRAALHKHEPDHIVPRQHDGQTVAANLALACFNCNRCKGPNVGSFDLETGVLTPFFNPRTQAWTAHFYWAGPLICSLTAEARVTIRILRLNDEGRVAERQRLMEAGLFV